MSLPPRPPSRNRTEARYRELRRAALRDAAAALAAAGVNAELRSIDAAALTAAERWSNMRVGWPWHLMIPDWRRNHPERFEVAIWQGEVLDGLGLGRPAPVAPHLSLYYLERNPEPANPLRGKITGAAIDSMIAYGIILGKTEIRLVDPLPAVVPRYCSPVFGFHLVMPANGTPYRARSI